MDENRYVMLLETLRSIGLQEATLESQKDRMLESGVPEEQVAEHLRDVIQAGRIWADYNECDIDQPQAADALATMGMTVEQVAQWFRYMYRVAIDTARKSAELQDADLEKMAEGLQVEAKGLRQTYMLARAVIQAAQEGFAAEDIAADLVACGAMPPDLAKQTVDNILFADQIGTRIRAGEEPDAILADTNFDDYPVYVLALAVGYGKEHKRFMSLVAGTRTAAVLSQLS